MDDRPWTRTPGGDGWVTEISQSAYGHRARKPTWLYYVGPKPPPLRWDDPPVSAIVSGFTHQRRGEHVACEHRRVRPREASRTPEPFRDALLALARAAWRPELMP